MTFAVRSLKQNETLVIVPTTCGYCIWCPFAWMQSINDDFMGVPLASYGGLVALSLLFEKTILCALLFLMFLCMYP